MFEYRAEFEDGIFYTSENYNNIIDFIEKSNKKGRWRIYANIVKDRFDLIDEFNNKEPIEQDLPKSFTKGGVTITLEKDIDDEYTIVISINVNGEKFIDNMEAHIGNPVGKEGIYLTVLKNNFIGPPDVIYTCINDYQELIQYLYKLEKNKELLKNYIKTIKKA
jgi:hypothetical protein